MRYSTDPPAERPWPPELRRVITVDEVHERKGQAFRVVTLAEVWAHGVVLRWLHSGEDFVAAVEAADGGGFDFFQAPEVEDDAGTDYQRRGGGSAGGFAGMEAAATFVPAPPPEATTLRLSWPGGEQTVIALSGT